MEGLAQIVSTLGFPIAIAVYLLWREERKDKGRDSREEKLVTALVQSTEIIRQSNKLREKSIAALDRNTNAIDRKS